MKPPRVLLIEDGADTVSLYRTQLERDGFVLTSAREADTGLALAREEHPDIILLDLMLPGRIGGFELLDVLVHDPQTKGIPVLALTNLAEEVGFERAVSHGAVGYVVKSDRTPRQVSLLITQILREKATHPPKRSS